MTAQAIRYNTSMITVIIAGGSGTRLWPLSTANNPKQLLQLTGDRSMVQQAYDRATHLGDKTYVVTEASHSDELRAQLPELPDEAFLIEPGRRGTGNCIVFALDIIARQHDPDEPIAFVHSDHFIRDVDGYTRSLNIAAEASSKTKKVTLVGIEPTFPSTSFGYIERDGEIGDTNTYQIQSFKEKPDFSTAETYLRAGRYLWNCGYFIGSADTFLTEIKAVAPDLEQSYEILSSIKTSMSDEYNQAYLAFPNLIIDYALAERSRNLAVVPASFDWMDVGNFKDLHNANEKDEAGNYFKGENVYPIEVENAYIRNEEDKPIAVIGLDNVVVVNTPDGLLVARKDVAARVGEVAKKLQG